MSQRCICGHLRNRHSNEYGLCYGCGGVSCDFQSDQPAVTPGEPTPASSPEMEARVEERDVRKLFYEALEVCGHDIFKCEDCKDRFFKAFTRKLTTLDALKEGK